MRARKIDAVNDSKYEEIIDKKSPNLSDNIRGQVLALTFERANGKKYTNQEIADMLGLPMYEVVNAHHKLLKMLRIDHQHSAVKIKQLFLDLDEEKQRYFMLGLTKKQVEIMQLTFKAEKPLSSLEIGLELDLCQTNVNDMMRRMLEKFKCPNFGVTKSRMALINMNQQHIDEVSLVLTDLHLEIVELSRKLVNGEYINDEDIAEQLNLDRGTLYKAQCSILNAIKKRKKNSRLMKLNAIKNIITELSEGELKAILEDSEFEVIKRVINNGKLNTLEAIARELNLSRQSVSYHEKNACLKLLGVEVIEVKAALQIIVSLTEADFEEAFLQSNQDQQSILMLVSPFTSERYYTNEEIAELVDLDVSVVETELKNIARKVYHIGELSRSNPLVTLKETLSSLSDEEQQLVLKRLSKKRLALVEYLMVNDLFNILIKDVANHFGVHESTIRGRANAALDIITGEHTISIIRKFKLNRINSCESYFSEIEHRVIALIRDERNLSNELICELIDVDHFTLESIKESIIRKYKQYGKKDRIYHKVVQEFLELTLKPNDITLEMIWLNANETFFAKSMSESAITDLMTRLSVNQLKTLEALRLMLDNDLDQGFLIKITEGEGIHYIHNQVFVNDEKHTEPLAPKRSL